MKRLRALLLKLADGVERERYEHLQTMKKSFEEGYEALRSENRQLKTMIKELKLQDKNKKQKA